MGVWENIRQFFFGEPTTKAMDDLHPELRDRQPLMRVRGNQTWIASPYPYQQAVNDHAGNVWMGKAVKIVSDNVAVVPLQVVQDGKPVQVDIPLLAKPNDTQACADVWRAWAVSMMLGGETGLEVVKAKNGRTLLEWWVRTPDVIRVVPDPARVRYSAVAGFIIDDQSGDPYTLLPDEFVHFKFYNPRDPWRGLSPFIAARLSMKIDRNARAWAEDFFENSARPDFAVMTPQGTSRAERADILAEVLALYRGTQNGAIVLEQEVTDIKPLSFAPKDIDFTSQREMSRDEVGAAAGIPDILLGFGNDSYDTPDKRVNAEETMWSLTIKPLLDYRDQVLTMFFQRAGVLKPAQQIASDLSGIKALKGDYMRKLDQARALYSMNVPFNKIDEVLTLGIGQIPGGETGMQDRAASLLGAPPNDAPAQLDAGVRIVKLAEKGLSIPKGDAVEFGGALHREMFDLAVKRADPYEQRFAEAVAALFRRQKADVIARVRQEAKSIAELGDDPFDQEEWASEFAKSMRPEYRRIIGAAGQNAVDDVSAGMSFDLLDWRVVSALRKLPQRFAKRVNETTWRMLKDALTAGIEAGEGADKLASRVEETMTLRIDQSSGAIARTEVQAGTTAGTVEGWRQSGMVQQKVWVATFDDRVRDTHADAHGQTVALDDDFTVGTATGPGPGQMDEAGETINCRCTMVAIQE